MTNEQIVQKAHYYAEHPELSPYWFRRGLDEQERALFDSEMLAHRCAYVEGKLAKYSPSLSFRRVAA